MRCCRLPTTETQPVKQHREKTLIRNRQFYKENAERLRTESKAYRDKNPEKIKELNKRANENLLDSIVRRALKNGNYPEELQNDKLFIDAYRQNMRLKREIKKCKSDE